MDAVAELIKRLDCIVVDAEEKSMNATVVWPGKDWDNKPEYGGGKRTSATFQLEDGTEVKVNSSNPNSPKAMFLKGLKKGDTVALEHNKARGDISEFYDIDTWALIAGGVGGGGKKEESSTFMEDFEASRNRAKWFQEQGIKLATELYADMAKLEGLEVESIRDFEEEIGYAIFQRGGALGVSLHMDMINKGHR